MIRARREDAERASSSIGSMILVFAVILVAATVGSFFVGLGQELHSPPRAAISISQTTLPGGACGGGHDEVALDVTLVAHERAESIYVEPDEGNVAVLWSNLDGSDVGDTRRVAAEQVGTHGVDVTLGAASESICPGDERFRFYASADGESTLLRAYTVT